MAQAFSTFIRDESGATMIEYGLIAALVSITIVGTLQTFGSTLTNWFFTISGELVNAVNGG